MYAVGVLMLLFPAILSNLDAEEIWRRIEWQADPEAGPKANQAADQASDPQTDATAASRLQGTTAAAPHSTP
jgi:hypothetical protein